MLFDLRVLLPLAVAAAVSLALGVSAWRRGAPGARAFAILMFATAEWAATYALEMVAADLPDKLAWERLTYIGSALVAPAWLLFTVSFTGWHPRLGRRTVFFLLALQPLLDWALVWTNDSHGLMWSSFAFDNADRSLPLSFDYGPVYFAMLIYNYAVMLFGVWLITRILLQSGRLYSRQSLALLVGVAAPLAGNVVYNAGFVGTIDPTAFAFTITGLSFFWGFQRYGLLDLAPVARNSIFQVLRDAVVVLDTFDRVVDVNPAAELVLGRAAAHVVGNALSEVSSELAVLVHGLVDAPASRPEIEFLSAADPRHYEVCVSPLHGRGTRLTGRVIVMTDITLRRAAEESVRASHQFIQEVIANAGEGIVVYDRTLHHVMWNPFMQYISGASAAEVVGRSAMECFPRLIENGIAELLVRALAGETVHSGDLSYTLPDTGEVGWYAATYAPRRDAAGLPDGVIGIIHDVTERKRAEEVLSHRALHDLLTDLPNRALFQTRLGQAIREAAGDRSGMALLVVDLDGFKIVNDTLGHGSGDVLLQDLAQRWQSVLGDADTLARLGGDEFAVVLPATSGHEAASLIADRLKHALVRSFVVDGQSIQVGASVGIALYPEHGEDSVALLRHADMAMYVAKRLATANARYSDDHLAAAA